jgi:RNA polymerase sigma-70 factor (ECF subfamily)
MGGEVKRRSSSGRFEDLYRTHVRALLAYALRRVGRAEEAADVVADTMLVAWRRLPEVPPGDEARLWLFGVARRMLANERRGRDRRDRLGERLRGELSGLVAADHAAAVAGDLALHAALSRLDELDREVLMLTGWEGLRPGEIALVLDVAPATVRTRLHRARRRLHQELAEHEPALTGHVAHDERLLVRDAEDER